MRLAFLTHEPFFPPSGGGSAEAPYLMNELVRRGHQVHLFCPEFPDSKSVALQFGISIHPFTRWKMGRYTRLRNLKYLLYPLALTRHADQVLADLNQSTEGKFRFEAILAQHTIAGVAGGHLRRRWKVPLVMNFLDYLTGFMETWPALFTRTGFVPLLNQFELSMPRRFDAEGIMTASTPLAERFSRTGYPSEKIRAIHYGYDAKLFAPGTEIPSPQRPVVVMHGSFDRHHLGPIARGAVLEIHASRPKVIFRFVGRVTPVLAEFTRDLRQRAPSLELETTGFVPYATVADQLRGATLGIVPYEASEGVHCAFVAKAVEYLGCGLNCVSTPLENLQGYFRSEPALHFSGWDAHTFAGKVLQVLNQSPDQRRASGLAASRRVSRELDWRIIASNAVDFTEQRTQPTPSLS